jgi:hypothetical protein
MTGPRFMDFADEHMKPVSAPAMPAGSDIMRLRERPASPTRTARCFRIIN